MLYKAKTVKKDNPRSEFNNRWVEGDLIHSGGKLYIHPISNKVTVEGELGKLIVMHEVDPDTLCQETNYTDRNGVKIWTNDILHIQERCRVFTERNSTKITTYLNDFKWKCATDSFGLTRLNAYTTHENIEKFEVIGNIFDNPDLLERK